MNIKTNTLILAPVFLDFEVAEDIAIQDGKVEFTLQYRFDFISDASIECSMPLLECTQGFAVGDSDPQNCHEIDIPAFKAIENTLVTVMKTDAVATKEGNEFVLLPEQLRVLNELIFAWCEEQFLKESEQQATYVAEDMAEEIYG